MAHVHELNAINRDCVEAHERAVRAMDEERRRAAEDADAAGQEAEAQLVSLRDETAGAAMAALMMLPLDGRRPFELNGGSMARASAADPTDEEGSDDEASSSFSSSTWIFRGGGAGPLPASVSSTDVA